MDIGVKLKLLREQQGMSQLELSTKTNYHRSYISKIETGERELNDGLLHDIKMHLGITDIPITEEEVNLFRNELYEWFETIKNRQIDEAIKLRPIIKRKAEKSLEPDLATLYYLFELRLLHHEGNLEKEKEILDCLSEQAANFSKEYLYYYNYAYGLHYYKQMMNKEALKFFLEAENIDKELKLNECNLYYTIANLYSQLDYIAKVFVYISTASSIAKSNHQATYDIDMDIISAINYIRINEGSTALQLLFKCLNQAKTAKNDYYMGMIYHNIGYAYMRMNKYNEALRYYGEALDYYQNDVVLKSYAYLEQAYIYTLTGNQKEAEKNIETGCALAENHEDITILFKSLVHSQMLKNSDSLYYIENVTIPMLSNKGRYLLAIDYCRLLADHFGPRNSKKALVYSKLANEYYDTILKGEL